MTFETPHDDELDVEGPNEGATGDEEEQQEGGEDRDQDLEQRGEGSHPGHDHDEGAVIEQAEE